MLQWFKGRVPSSPLTPEYREYRKLSKRAREKDRYEVVGDRNQENSGKLMVLRNDRTNYSNQRVNNTEL